MEMFFKSLKKVLGQLLYNYNKTAEDYRKFERASIVLTTTRN